MDILIILDAVIIFLCCLILYGVLRRKKSDRKGDVEREAGRQAEKGENEKTDWEKQEKRRDDEQGKRTRRKKRTRKESTARRKESTARRKNERESGQVQKTRRVQERQGAGQGRDAGVNYYMQECLENSDCSEYIRTFNRRISTVSPASQAFRGIETFV